MKRWIQKAIKKEGALKEWIKRNKKKIIGAIKENPLTKDGKIKITALKKIKKTKLYQKLDKKTKSRINLAITLKKLRKK
ncbi:MAG: hypothetical protein ABIL47_08000 [candidate division WOR-3 bacterium]